jgi:hypothetical protein
MNPLRRTTFALCLAMAASGVGPPSRGQLATSGQGASGGVVAAPAAGGSASADFDSLIDLIVSTVAPDTWAENGGGQAEVRPFPTGVWIDPQPVIATATAGSSCARPVATPRPAKPAGDPRHADPHRASPLRCVSLPRLEAEVLRRSVAGEPLDEAMLTLAGLRRAERLVVIPPAQPDEPGDLILAGPAGDWTIDADKRLVASDTGLAVVRLDDLVTLLRRERREPGAPLGCAITPRAAGLAAAQRALDAGRDRPVPPGGRAAWLEEVRAALGAQDVELFGIDPSTNAARVLVEADRHMKRVGLGDEPAVPGVASYLDRVAAASRAGDAPPRLSVLRWWFAANYEGVERSAGGDSLRLRGAGLCVLSENELLTRRGERVHTGQSDPHNEGFARDFTNHFDELARAYPVYSELRNVFDLAILAALVQSEGLVERAGWAPSLFFDADRLPTPRLRFASAIETIATSRVVARRRILAAVSGGVWIDPARVPLARVADGAIHTSRGANAGDWWWDAAP